MYHSGIKKIIVERKIRDVTAVMLSDTCGYGMTFVIIRVLIPDIARSIDGFTAEKLFNTLFAARTDITVFSNKLPDIEIVTLRLYTVF